MASSSVVDASPRSVLSCAECRRLKRKCDKNIPCSHCVRRKCPELCPNGRQTPRPTASANGLLGELQTPLNQDNANVRLSSTGPLSISSLRSPRQASPSPRTRPYPVLAPSGRLETRTATDDRLNGVDLPVPDSSIHGGIIPGLSEHDRSYDSVIYSSHHGDLQVSPTTLVSPNVTSAFPFHPGSTGPRSDSISRKLPPIATARALIDAYQKYFTWLHDVVPSATLDRILQDTYAPPYDHQKSGWQCLALLFAVFAVGSLYSLESAARDPIGQEYLNLAETCLAEGGFLRKCSGEGLQALHLMGQFHLETRQDRDGDTTWQIWGIAMRAVQTMDLHREDEQRLQSDEVAEGKRKLFWECYSDDVFAANGRMRPSAFQRNYVSARFPSSDDPKDAFCILKYRLSRLTHEILDLTLENRYNPYSALMALNDKIRRLEETIPAHLRCTTTMAAKMSMVPNPPSEPLNGDRHRNDLRTIFERHTLDMLTSAAYLFLHRPYYAGAIRDPDPLSALFAYSYMIVAERSGVIIETILALNDLYPDLTARHSIFWYHLFAAAASLGSLLINCPTSALTSFARCRVQQAAEMFRALNYRIKSPLIQQNYHMLDTILQRSQDSPEASVHPRDAERVSPEMVEWEARLLARVKDSTPRQHQAGSHLLSTPIYNPSAHGEAITGVNADGLNDAVGGDWFQQLWDDLFSTAEPFSA